MSERARAAENYGECSGAEGKVSSEVVSLAVNVQCKLQFTASHDQSKSPVCFPAAGKEKGVIALKTMSWQFHEALL